MRKLSLEEKDQVLRSNKKIKGLKQREETTDELKGDRKETKGKENQLGLSPIKSKSLQKK